MKYFRGGVEYETFIPLEMWGRKHYQGAVRDYVYDVLERYSKIYKRYVWNYKGLQFYWRIIERYQTYKGYYDFHGLYWENISYGYNADGHFTPVGYIGYYDHKRGGHLSFLDCSFCGSKLRVPRNTTSAAFVIEASEDKPVELRELHYAPYNDGHRHLYECSNELCSATRLFFRLSGKALNEMRYSNKFLKRLFSIKKENNIAMKRPKRLLKGARNLNLNIRDEDDIEELKKLWYAEASSVLLDFAARVELQLEKENEEQAA